ncbi:FMN-binding negative transcriptional regulator [Sphingomonas cannabina]|uniref:FMN-binding negative transcriptional regulator n=1 Tax=Sphingomonas cannabina TaxID=2899123 RepID=UPI001F20DD62|nr:FMN-binding negative transcriptional regulator [Sphingomonas cannabina]UIJ45678.1 FMN-binding negative transcriptional regulator [Sphingomonas cannabina]
MTAPGQARPGLFVPDVYRADDPAAIVGAYPFALLITTDEAGIRATSCPIVFERDGATDRLLGHMARRNPHAPALSAGQHALAVFSGPHAYVSPRWYVEKPQVPTWDYVAAHVRGTLEPIDDEAGQLALLERTAACLERSADRPWTLDDAPEGRVAMLLPMIRSFRIHVDSIEGVTKLSQSHPPGDRARVAEALMRDDDTRTIARMIADLDRPR